MINSQTKQNNKDTMANVLSLPIKELKDKKLNKEIRKTRVNRLGNIKKLFCVNRGYATPKLPIKGNIKDVNTNFKT